MNSTYCIDNDISIVIEITYRTAKTIKMIWGHYMSAQMVKMVF